MKCEHCNTEKKYHQNGDSYCPNNKVCTPHYSDGRCKNFKWCTYCLSKENIKLYNKMKYEKEYGTDFNWEFSHPGMSLQIDEYLEEAFNMKVNDMEVLKNEFDGISIKYSEEISSSHIKTLRKKGLKIQIWTINSEEDISEAISINPDFIQSDNVKYFE